jgi:hypothetical protein
VQNARAADAVKQRAAAEDGILADAQTYLAKQAVDGYSDTADVIKSMEGLLAAAPGSEKVADFVRQTIDEMQTINAKRMEKSGGAAVIVDDAGNPVAVRSAMEEATKDAPDFVGRLAALGRSADPALLKAKGLKQYIRTKEEVNKEAILADPESVASCAWIKIEQAEDFVIVPFETELEEVA